MVGINVSVANSQASSIRSIASSISTLKTQMGQYGMDMNRVWEAVEMPDFMYANAMILNIMASISNSLDGLANDIESVAHEIREEEIAAERAAAEAAAKAAAEKAAEEVARKDRVSDIFRTDTSDLSVLSQYTNAGKR